jgi:hypothetical protein
MDNPKAKYDMNSVADRIAHFFATPSEARTLKLIEYSIIGGAIMVFGICELVLRLFQ